MRIVLIPVVQINPAPYNPRRDLQPGDAKYEALKASIDRWDTVEPLVWNERSGNLVGGHQRLKILLARGDTEVTVSAVDLDEVNERGLNIALNRLGNDWDVPRLADILLDFGEDFDLSLTGFDAGEIAGLMSSVGAGVEPVTVDAAFAAVPSGERSEFETISFSLHRSQGAILREALAAAKALGPFVDAPNENSNGNALARVAEVALGVFRQSNTG